MHWLYQKEYLITDFLEPEELLKMYLVLLATQFTIFRRPIITNVDTVTRITKALVALHSFPMFDRDFTGNNYCPGNYVDFEVNNSVVQLYCIIVLYSFFILGKKQ